MDICHAAERGAMLVAILVRLKIASRFNLYLHVLHCRLDRLPCGTNCILLFFDPGGTSVVAFPVGQAPSKDTISGSPRLGE